MNNSEIKSLSINELQERVISEKENLQKLKFAHAISPIENPMKISQAKRLIARMNTELTIKQNSNA
ncbi:MAG: 50S ribosomal protein L29 [Bacteroidetes bacterium]|jgi:large subunit ribosomal protein L29|nr:50S ribosomal protein L29 [Bacteroidota bacterium]